MCLCGKKGVADGRDWTSGHLGGEVKGDLVGGWGCGIKNLA